MTILMDSSCFNEEVIKQVETIRDILFNKITPENIHYFDGSIINILRDRFWSNDIGGILWGESSNINGYDISKINGMIRYLKSFQTETAVKYFNFRPEENYESGDYVEYEYSEEVPRNYDGRNAFVQYLSTWEDYEELDLSTPTLGYPFKKNNLFIFGGFLANLAAKTITTVDISQTKTRIKIKTKFRKSSTSQIPSSLTIYGKITYWRFL